MNKYTLAGIEGILMNEGLLIESQIKGKGKELVDLITDNSKEAIQSCLFICKGSHFKEEYLLEALEGGAIAYLTEDPDLLGHASYFYVQDVRRSMAILANLFYGESWKKLKLIGITGTKGKSTTAYMVKSILDDYLEKSGRKCGILSSIENYDGDTTEESRLTTQEPLQLHKSFYTMVNNACDFCVMEVSSQALKYDRVLGVSFDIGAFLNIGEDHISDVEHSSFEDYLESKKKILLQSKLMIMNDTLDLDFKEDGIKTFGFQELSDYRVLDIDLASDANSFTINGLGRFKIKLRGDFNILNAAAAIAIAYELGIPLSNIEAGLYKASASGRMELFVSEDKTKVAIVDYAHNKLSYEALFQSIEKEYPDYKVISIFGCPGSKAQGRRKELAQIAEKHSDYIYITEEDHGEESLKKINEEIYSNIEDKSKAEVEEDRKKAILSAFNKFEEKTIILILGKGRETRQKRGTEYVPVESDVEIVEKNL